VAGVEAQAEALVAARGVDERVQLGRRAPSVPPAPAVFSRCSGQRSDSASASAMTSPARVIASPTSPVFADPGCSTTATASSSAPARSELMSDVSVFSRISGSSDAQLSR
jgi:hypothetical protein